MLFVLVIFLVWLLLDDYASRTAGRPTDLDWEMGPPGRGGNDWEGTERR